MLSIQLPRIEDDEAVMLRLVVILAIWVLSGPAQADTVDVASLVRDGGPWGMVTVLCSVIGILWYKLGALQATIDVLHDKRATENAEWAGKFATTATTAANEIRQTVEKLEDQGRLLQAVTETAKGWPSAIQSILSSLESNRDRIGTLPDALRIIIQQSKGA